MCAFDNLDIYYGMEGEDFMFVIELNFDHFKDAIDLWK